MKRKIFVLIGIVVLIVVISLIYAKPLRAMSWVKCATHDHSDRSDGMRSFRQSALRAKKCGFKVYIPSDHIEQLPEKGGFQAYLDLCNEDYGITIIPGVEVMIGSSHTVVFGGLTVESLEALNKAKTISEIIRIAQEFGLFTVAAHAFQSAYPYDMNHVLSVNGEEWLNDTSKNFTKYLNLGISYEKLGKEVFFWAGQDSHTGVDPQDKERWQRTTWVYAESASRTDILEAMSEGRTYVSGRGFSLDYITPLPGFEVHETKPRLQFVVRSQTKTTKDHVIKIYRGSELIKSITMKKGSLTQKVDFLDTKATIGTKLYLVVVDPVIAVTPIRIDISEIIPDEKTETLVPEGLVTLLKKTRAEVDAILGEETRTWDSPGNYRAYEGKPSANYNTYINFRPDIAGLSAMKEWNNVWAMVIKPNVVIKSSSMGLSVRAVVPAVILKTKPFGTYAIGIDNVVATVWYINHQTFLLLRDSHTPLMTTVRPRYGRPRHIANKNTQNLNIGWVYHFGCVDKTAKIKTSRDYFGGPDDHQIVIDLVNQSLYALYYFVKK